MTETESTETINLTQKACDMAHELGQSQTLRLYLEGKGCDGFYYGVCFDEKSPEDFVFPQALGLELVVDPDTLEFVKGAVIDWVDDERGRGFLVENPRHSRFRGKFYKRSFWQKRFEEKQQNTKTFEN